MRKPTYLSPSALKLFETNRDEWFVRYLCEYRAPAMPQTQPMSVGSAFDAYAKSYFHNAIYGPTAEFELETIFSAQVEPHNRDWAWVAGKHVFDGYVASGSASDLMLQLNGAVDPPRFEFTVSGVVGGIEGGVPLLGKPDIRFVSSGGAHVIYDFKVNGYCGRGNTSPMAGYISLVEQNVGGVGWQRRGAHRDAMPAPYLGVTINMAGNMESYDPEWATQLCTYGWLMGEDVGREIVVGIQQIACDGSRSDLGKPRLRIATHCSRVGAAFQIRALARYQACWAAVTSGWVFSDLTKEESDARCELLTGQARLLVASPGSLESWIVGLGRTQRGW